MNVSANQWLLDNNFIERITRGRRSRENNIRLHEAYLSGIRFTDWEPKEGTDSKGEYATTNAKPVQSTTAVVGEITYTWPEESWEAYAEVNGKKIPVGMRECCTNCYEKFGRHVSLVGHWCLTPSVSTVLHNIGTPTPVKIVPRTTPLPNKRW